MLLRDYFKEELIILDLDVVNVEDVFKKMSNVFYKNGYVKETFYNGLVEREKVFPTGLTLERYNVAIPHTDIEHVNKPAIAIATLKQPVEFKSMCDMDEKVEVNIVFMMALSEPHSQVKMLQQLMGLIQDECLIQKIISASSAEEVIELTHNVKY